MKSELIDAGSLNRYAQYQTKTESADNFGQPTETWSTIYNLWVSVRSPNGRESLEAAQRTASVNRVVEHHYFDAATDPRARYVLDDGAILNVVWTVDPDAGRAMIRAFCSQQVVPV